MAFPRGARVSGVCTPSRAATMRRAASIFASLASRGVALPSGVRASAFAPLSSRRAFASGARARARGIDPPRDDARERSLQARESVARGGRGRGGGEGDARPRRRAHVGAAHGVRGLRRARARPRVRSRVFHPIPRLLRILLRILLLRPPTRSHSRAVRRRRLRMHRRPRASPRRAFRQRHRRGHARRRGHPVSHPGRQPPVARPGAVDARHPREPTPGRRSDRRE